MNILIINNFTDRSDTRSKKWRKYNTTNTNNKLIEEKYNNMAFIELYFVNGHYKIICNLLYVINSYTIIVKDTKSKVYQKHLKVR